MMVEDPHMSPQHLSQTARHQHVRGQALFGAPVSLAPSGFRIFLSLAVLVLTWLHQAGLLQMIGLGGPAWALGVLGAVLAYWFAETLLTLFVLLLPPALFLSAVIAWAIR
jgi:hypothetical protein